MSDQKGWANPSPAGLVALAVACFTFYALLSGKVDHTAIPLLACWLLGGFVVQLIVGILEMLEGNSTGGNVFTVFAAFFMLVGGLEFLIKYFASVNGWTIDAGIDGYAWLVLAIALVMWTPAYFKGPLFMTLAVVCVDVAVVIIAGMDLGILARSLSPIAGGFLGIAGLLALWISSAIVLASAYGRPILPNPGPIVKG